MGAASETSPIPAMRVEPVHDFAAKLRQPALLEAVRAYVAWQRAVREARACGAPKPRPPDAAPLSINLDLTTACNYACDHCIDWEILNQGITHEEAVLRASIVEMARRGLKSVILIGGGEPTVHPGFPDFLRFLKDQRLQTAVVSNGSRNGKIGEAIDRLDEHDWIRLSLDAGTDDTFQLMHKPKKPITLDAICAGVAPWKARNPAPRIGFSFIITWTGAMRGPGAPILENIDEIPLAARRARDAGFDYVSFKPFLTRRENGSEVMDPSQSDTRLDDVVRRIRARVDEAKALASPVFRVVESTNLRVLESGTWRSLTQQPRMCHMQALRQVLTPLGLYNCPAHRGAPKALIAGKGAYADAASCASTAGATAAILDRFDASHECAEVTCLYHGANWWLEHAIADETPPPILASLETEDWFL
jgi:hypothetical protein